MKVYSDTDLELTIFKKIAARMNTDLGSLLLGVGDGNIRGIEKDMLTLGIESRQEFEDYIHDRLKTQLDVYADKKDFNTRSCVPEGHVLCLIEILEPGKPVTCSQAPQSGTCSQRALRGLGTG
jgi:predicted HTH transcriptional regulator